MLRTATKSFPKSAGLTLVEMLMAASITAILIALAAPSFSGIISQTRLANHTNDLHFAIRLARSEAIKRHALVTLLPVGGKWTQGWTVFVDANANKKPDGTEFVVLQHEPLSTGTTVSYDTTPGYIAFSPSGEPERYNGAFLSATLALCNGGSSRMLVIAKSGRVRLAKGQC